MAFFAGGTMMTVFITILVLCIPFRDVDWGEDIIANLPTFKFIFMIIFLLVATAIDIRIFK